MDLRDKKTKITVLSVCFLLCVLRSGFAIVMAIKWAGRGNRFMCFTTGIAPTIVFFLISYLIVWILIRDYVLKKKVKRMKPATVYKLIMGLACAMILTASILALTGCSKKEPTRHPTFANFDVVKITLSGKKAQIINNRVEFDYSRNCWLVQVKMAEESMIGRMARKVIGRHEVKDGWGNLTLFEAELEPWREAIDGKKTKN